MADTPEPPKTAAKPATARRRAPRKTAVSKPATAAQATAAKPAAAKPATAKRAASAPPTPPKRATAKPRSASRPTPAPKRAAPPKAAETKSEKTGGKWGTAAVVGGLAAVGAAATAALLSLRSSTPKADPKPTRGAHTATGEDATRSFKAGIADEGTIPD